MEKENKISRKEFLKLAAGAGLAGAALAVSPATAAAAPAKNWAMVMDVRKCIGCHACTVACKAENSVPLGVWRTQIRTYEKGTYPHVKRHFFPWICNHCGYCAAATQAAGAGTFYRREDGIVLMDYRKLEGKSREQIRAEADTAISACTVGAVFTNPLSGLPEKCTFCAHRVDKGLVPACVQTCLGKARVFGDLADPKSVVSRLISDNPTTKLCPDGKVYYIGAEGHQIDSIKGSSQIDTNDLEKGVITQYI